MSNLSNKIINGIRTVAGKKNLPLHEPRFDENEIKNLQKCIDSSYVSTVGKYVNIFEKNISDFMHSNSFSPFVIF